MAKIDVGTKMVEVAEYIEVCDGCGRQFGLPAEPDRSWFVENDAKVEFNFGYSSEHDMGEGEFKFCPKCADKVWDSVHTLFPKLELEQRTEW